MKYAGLVLFGMLLLAGTVSADPDASAERRFQEGVSLYRSADYRGAVETFEKLTQDGYGGFDLHSNLGAASYKNGDLGKSILYYERALLLEPGSADVRHNLNVVRARLRDRVDPIPLLFFVQWWNDIKTGHRPETMFVWSLVLLWLLAAAAFVFFGFRGVVLRRVALVAGIVLLALFSATLTLSLVRSEEIEAHRDAVIMATEVPVRSAADASGVESFVVHEGLVVRILESRQGQSRIRLADGKTGWIDTSALERI